MAWVAVSHKSKDDAFGVVIFNALVDDLNYLKTQSEVLVAGINNSRK